LRWNKHIANVSKAANSTLAFLKRNIRTSNQDIKTLAYSTIVRPKLEYAASVWDPHTIKDIRTLEMVQRRAARWVLGRYNNTSSVTDMMKTLKWDTLQSRRQASRLTMMYKITNNLVALQHDLKPPNRRTRNSHSHTYVQIQTRTETQRHSYFPRTVKEWNGLPDNVVSAPSLMAFRTRLSGTREH
jgi:hypothetical protein